MTRLSKVSIWIALFALCTCASLRVWAFSLRGPAAVWMTPRLGYNINTESSAFGPMNIEGEYRFNVPTLYYAYSPDFLAYFGQHGVDEIEKAVKIINDLPPADEIDLDDYPLASQRVNHRAQALGLTDLKSLALTVLTHRIGLANPTRFVFTLRTRWTTQTTTNYYVIKRNFDPDTWTYSSFINGQLWTYTTIVDNAAPNESLAVTAPVDPLSLGGLIHAPVAAGNLYLQVGGFWTGLTRDDVGGIKYIYRSQNYNVETAATNALAAGFGAVSSVGGGSPWTIPGPVVGTPGVIPGASTNFVNVALRPGIQKLTLQRVFYDSQFGFFVSNNVTYADSFVTNSTLLRQTLIRPLVTPDFVFDAADLTGSDTQAGGFFAAGITELDWQNNDALNGYSGDDRGNFNGAPGENLGPGTIPPSLGTAPSAFIIYNNVGPIFLNTFPTGSLSEPPGNSSLLTWASFDGSTNAPFIYPQGTSIQEVERRVLGGGGDSSSGGGGVVLSPWTIPLPITTNAAAGTGADIVP